MAVAVAVVEHQAAAPLEVHRLCADGNQPVVADEDLGEADARLAGEPGERGRDGLGVPRPPDERALVLGDDRAHEPLRRVGGWDPREQRQERQHEHERRRGRGERGREPDGPVPGRRGRGGDRAR